MCEWVVGPAMAPDARKLCEVELGARDGDTVIVRRDGSVGLARFATAAGAFKIASALEPSTPGLPAAWLRRAGGRRATDPPSHLQLVRDVSEGQSA